MDSDPKSSPRLVVVEGREKGKIIPLRDGTVIIGRSKGDIIVHDARMSRSHVAIHYTAEKGILSFTDLRSLNGTIVNGKPQHSGELQEGDRLILGDTVFDCQLQSHQQTGSISLVSISGVDENKKGLSAGVAVGEQAESEAGSTPSYAPPDTDSEEEEHVHRQEATNPTEHLPYWKRIYLHASPKTRRLTLCLVALLGVLVYVSIEEGGSEDLLVQLTEVRQLASQGRLQEAITLAESLRPHHQSNPELFLALGELYLKQQRNELALLAFQKARDRNPDDPRPYIKLLSVYLSAGLIGEANQQLKQLEAMIGVWPENKELFVEVAGLLIDYRELEPSSEKAYILSKALQNEIAPKSSIGYKLEAQVLFQQNRPKRALAVLEKARTLAAQDEWILENLALAMFRLKEFPRATKVVTDWIAVRPNSTKALLILSYLKFATKQYEQTIGHLKQLFKAAGTNTRDPHYAEALNLAGQVYLQWDQKKDARRLIRSACQLGFQQSCANPLLKTARKPQSIKAPNQVRLPSSRSRKKR